MQRSLLLPIVLAVTMSAFVVAAEPLRVHMISGAKEYSSEQAVLVLKKRLAKKYNIESTLSLAADGAKELPHLEKLAAADVLVIYARRLELDDKNMTIIKRWCEDGKPVVGIRTASHAFQPFLEFDKIVLGGDYSGHFGHESDTRVSIVDEAKAHPLLTGVKPWKRPAKFYKNPNLADDATLLMTGTGKNGTHPLAWARTYDKDKNARSFYTMAGLAEDFENENFLRLIDNAVFWTAHRDPPE
jgi:type 1 glutamine amidotransferase